MILCLCGATMRSVNIKYVQSADTHQSRAASVKHVCVCMCGFCRLHLADIYRWTSARPSPVTNVHLCAAISHYANCTLHTHAGRYRKTNTRRLCCACSCMWCRSAEHPSPFVGSKTLPNMCRQSVFCDESDDFGWCASLGFGLGTPLTKTTNAISNRWNNISLC